MSLTECIRCPRSAEIDSPKPALDSGEADLCKGLHFTTCNSAIQACQPARIIIVIMIQDTSHY